MWIADLIEWDKEYRLKNPVEDSDENAKILPDAKDYPNAFGISDWFKFAPMDAGYVTYDAIKSNKYTLDDWLEMNIRIAEQQRLNPKMF